MSSKTKKFQELRNAVAPVEAQAARQKQAEDCRNEVMQVLERRGFRMAAAQQTLDGQVVVLNIPLMIVFVPKEIAAQPVTKPE